MVVVTGGLDVGLDGQPRCGSVLMQRFMLNIGRDALGYRVTFMN